MKPTLEQAVAMLRDALKKAEYAIKGREHTGFIDTALAATSDLAPSDGPVGRMHHHTQNGQTYLRPDFTAHVPDGALLYSGSPPQAAVPEGYVLVPKRITGEMIESALEAHYGKRRVREVGGARGVDMTANDVNYSGVQALRRMWAGALAAAPMAPTKSTKPTGDSNA